MEDMKKKMKLIAVIACIFSMLNAPVVSAVGEVQTEEFNIPSQMQGALTTSISEDELSIRIATGSASTLDDGVTGVLYHSGTGEKGDFSEEVEGNIALIERGELTFWEKVDHAI